MVVNALVTSVVIPRLEKLAKETFDPLSRRQTTRAIGLVDEVSYCVEKSSPKFEVRSRYFSNDSFVLSDPSHRSPSCNRSSRAFNCPSLNHKLSSLLISHSSPSLPTHSIQQPSSHDNVFSLDKSNCYRMLFDGDVTREV